MKKPQEKNLEGKFQMACALGSIQQVQEMLLLKLDFNAVNLFKKTPFSLACYNGRKEIVELLLKDPRLDLSKELDKAALSGSFFSAPIYKTLTEALCSAVDKTILLSQNLVSVSTVSKICTLVANIKTILYPNKNNENYTQLVKARSKIFSSMEEKKINDIKAKLSIFEPAFAFTIMVLLSDDFVKIKTEAPDEIKRFFEIAKQLPIEMQMKIASKMFPNAPDNVSTNAVNWAAMSLFFSFEEDIEVIGDIE